MITILLLIAAFFLGKYFGAKDALKICDKVIKEHFEKQQRL